MLNKGHTTCPAVQQAGLWLNINRYHCVEGCAHTCVLLSYQKEIVKRYEDKVRQKTWRCCAKLVWPSSPPNRHSELQRYMIHLEDLEETHRTIKCTSTMLGTWPKSKFLKDPKISIKFIFETKLKPFELPKWKKSATTELYGVVVCMWKKYFQLFSLSS